MNDVLAELERIARQAALVVLEVYDKPFAVDYKAPRDPVTEADRRANELICEALTRAFPGVPIVAEESAPDRFSGFVKSPEVFFVDPVDGTREFVSKNGEFVIMIGLVEGRRATTAVIHAPALGSAWAAHVGSGAFRVDASGERQRVSVSEIAELDAARGVVSRSDGLRHLERVARALGTKELLPLGSMGLKAAQVAQGSADLYVAPGHAGKLWDACAPDALVTAAGGRFTDMTGQPIDYRLSSLTNPGGIVASNAPLHARIIEKWAELWGQRPRPVR